MNRLLLIFSVAALAVATTARGEEPSTQPVKDAKLVRATYLLTGLHCPPCTRTVETSLSQVKGIRSIKVDWKTKNASVEFDEATVTAEGVAHLIAATPHMMGGSMHYAGWLALKVPDLKDEATGKRVQEALRNVEGVKQVAVYPAQHSVGIEFSDKGDLGSQQIIDALAKEGIKAVNL